VKQKYTTGYHVKVKKRWNEWVYFQYREVCTNKRRGRL